jgi:hypothetical protein
MSPTLVRVVVFSLLIGGLYAVMRRVLGLDEVICVWVNATTNMILGRYYGIDLIASGEVKVPEQPGIQWQAWKNWLSNIKRAVLSVP